MDNSTAREIRKEFFAYRNGIVADKLRKAGDPHPVIMEELWDDTNSRECRLAAPMLYPAPLMTLETALEWCKSVETAEVADNLCHKLLRNLPDADALFRQLIAQDQAMIKYTGYRLLLNLMLSGKVKASPSLKSIVETEAAQAQPQLTALLRDLLEEF